MSGTIDGSRLQPRFLSLRFSIKLVMVVYVCSEHGGAESVVSGDKSFDEPGWGVFDTHYDTDSVWGFSTKVSI